MTVKFIAITAKHGVLSEPVLIAAATRAIVDTQAEGQRLMATYPAQWPNSHYRRTGTLKRSWQSKPVRRMGSSLSGEVASQGQIAPYNKKVQGVNQEATFAARGWLDVRALVKLVNKQFPPRVQRAFDAAALAGGRL